MFDKLLEIPRALNKPGSEYGTVVYARVSNMSDHGSIRLSNA